MPQEPKVGPSMIMSSHARDSPAGFSEKRQSPQNSLSLSLASGTNHNLGALLYPLSSRISCSLKIRQVVFELLESNSYNSSNIRPNLN